MTDKKTASFMRSLCSGEIEEEVLLPYPSFAPPRRRRSRPSSPR